MTTTTNNLRDLSLVQVKEAFANSGYGVDEVVRVMFTHVNDSGDHVYVMAWVDEDQGGVDMGMAFVTEKDGKLFAEF